MARNSSPKSTPKSTVASDAPRRSGAKPLVLHVSGDFPDPIEPFKTKAIKALIDLTADQFDHRVISINRLSPSRRETAREVLQPQPLRVDAQDFEYGTALSYTAPSRGVRHRTKLLQLGDWLTREIASMPRKPDLIMGHKLAIEGIAVRRAAEVCGLPYGLSIQGDSDTKIMDVRRDLTGAFSQVLNGAAITFPFAPWAWDRVTKRLAEPRGPHILLPCATELDQPIAPVIGGSGLLSVFHLKSHKRKNLAGMTRAVALLAKDGDAPVLRVIGGGDPDERAACEALIAQTPSISLEGQKDREEVRAAMNGAAAFVLPSLRESFGLVFIEALFAGLPIIYPRGTSVDGYFDGCPFALPVDARDPGAIALAMEVAITNEASMKAALAEWQQSDHARMFQRDHIAQSFAKGLLIGCGTSGNLAQ